MDSSAFLSQISGRENELPMIDLDPSASPSGEEDGVDSSRDAWASRREVDLGGVEGWVGTKGTSYSRNHLAVTFI